LTCIERDSKDVALGFYDVAAPDADFESFSNPTDPARGHVESVTFDTWAILASKEPDWVLRRSNQRVEFQSVYTPFGDSVCRPLASEPPTVSDHGIAGLQWGTDYDDAMPRIIATLGPTTAITEYRGRCRQRRSYFGDFVVEFDYDYMLTEQQSQTQLDRPPRLSMVQWPESGLPPTGGTRLTTDRGIALGSPLSDVKKAYKELLPDRTFGEQSRNYNMIVQINNGVVSWIYAFTSHGVACGD